jgi:hypothetical protein
MKQIIFLLTLVLSLSVTAQKKEKSTQLKSIDSLTTKMVQKRGIITTYLNEENKLFFEMDESVLKTYWLLHVLPSSQQTILPT